jgi:hypothetical protein
VLRARSKSDRHGGFFVPRVRSLLAAAIVGAICSLGGLDAAVGSDAAVPKSPDVVLKRSTTSGLLFTWSPVANASGYDLSLGTVHVGPTTYTRADFQNLACSTQYVLRVTSFDGAGRRSTASVTTARTDACQAASQQRPSEGPKPPAPPPPPAPNPPGGKPGPKPPPGPTPPPPSGGPPTAAVVVSPNGSDKNPCSATAPCASFGRAYAVAQPGQIVQMVGGRYPAQSIPANASKSSAAANVIFQPAPGATVLLANSTLTISGAHVEFHHLQMDKSGCANVKVAPPCPQLVIQYPAHDVVIDGLQSSRFFITGAHHVTVMNSDFGPSWDNHGIIHADTAGNRPHDITLLNSAVHDHWNSSACKAQAGCKTANHQGCGPTINDAYNVLEDGMRFFNCEDLGQLVKPYKFPNQNITIQNSYFGASNGFYSLSLTSNAAMPNQGLVIRNNVFTKGVSISAGIRYPNSVFSGNTLPGAACGALVSSGWVLSGNNFSGAACGGTPSGGGSGSSGGSGGSPSSVGSGTIGIPSPRTLGRQPS